MNSFFTLFNGKSPAKRTPEGNIFLEIRDLLKTPMKDYHGMRNMAIYDAHITNSNGKINIVISGTERVMSYTYELIHDDTVHEETITVSFKFPNGTRTRQNYCYFARDCVEEIFWNKCTDYRDIYRDSKARVLEALKGFLTEAELGEWNIANLEDALIDIRKVFA